MTARKTFSVVVMAAMVCLVGMSRDASASATVTLEWGACGGGSGGCFGLGTNELTLLPGGGQTVRLDIFLTHDEVTGMNANVFSLNFDTDLGNELNLTAGMPPVEWVGTDTNPGPGTDSYVPFTAGIGGTVESTSAIAGRLNSYDSGSVAPSNLPRTGLAYTVGTFTATAPARYRIGQAFFTVNAGVITDGADVFSGSFNGPAGTAGFDVSTNGLNETVSMNFGTATVNVIPEPGTVSLLGLGLVGLVLAGRRSRHA